VAEALREAEDVAEETKETWEATRFAMVACCMSILLSGVGSSVAGVMGNESVPEDREVERDTKVEANGVVAREDTALACLWEEIWGWNGRAAR
jgi:hypothetical protein